jgi:hypothetical protein
MTIQPLSPPVRDIDVTQPIGMALDHVQRMLFRPFDLSKWIIVGFCAWLAGLGESGGTGLGFHQGFNGQGNNGAPVAEQFRQMFDRVSLYVMANLNWIIPLAAFLFVAMLSIGLLILWLNSRGKFMFLHCVALDRAEVEIPWTQYSAQGNSLFWFRLVLHLFSLIISLPLIFFLVIDIIQMVKNGTPDVVGVLAAVGLGMGLFLLGLLLTLARKFTTDFVVPLMYLRGGKCTTAWGEFWRLLTANPGQFALYILFQIVLAIVICVLVLAVVLVTCCIAGCLMAIPFIGTVLLLPILIFKRSYSLFYLAQYGPEYDVFPAPAAVPAPAAPPTDGSIPPIGPLGT